MSLNIQNIVTIYYCFILFITAKADLFTAVVDLKKVLLAERDIAGDLRTYIINEKSRLEFLAGLADQLDAHSQYGLLDPEKHLSNPVKAFQLVKRFTIEWNDILRDHINNAPIEEFLESLQKRTKDFPDTEDLNGAAHALMRLQDTYSIPTHNITQGNVEGISDLPLMSAHDAFELGRIAYNDADFYHSGLWMSESLVLSEQENYQIVPKALLLDYIAYVKFKQGNIREALNITKELLLIEPDHMRGLTNLGYYKKLLEDDEEKGIETTIVGNERPLDEYRRSQEFTDYEKLCRGEQIMTYVHKKKLACRYKRHHALFFLIPLKEEELYLSPRITIYHDFISDFENVKIRELATPRLARATVQNAATGKLETATYRVSKSAWLRDEEDILISRISKRSSALSNLTLHTVEELQVVNYGLGGHYEPHFDFARKEEIHAFETWRGNRIVTLICYLSDVEAGGSTVFPRIGVQVKPIKGACALWYNLFRNGDGVYDTRHAACPVISGSKWVCNKWFHERGQEQIRKCTLNPME